MVGDGGGFLQRIRMKGDGWWVMSGGGHVLMADGKVPVKCGMCR